MTGADGKHVFISYVHEDSSRVDQLCAVLDAAQIPYWRDRTALGPGDAWRAKIKQAIREGALVFLACFSENSRAKDKSYMNEELTLAAEEFRLMPPGRTWLIPLRFDAGDVPDWDLGAGRALSDLNYVDLFGDAHMANAARLVTTIHNLTGEKRPDTATALAAVEQATHAGRTDLLKRLTKEMLLDPSRRIELDDLVAQEIQRVLREITEPDRLGRPITGSNDEQIVQIAEAARELWQLTEPFCASLRVAARWGTPELLPTWANGLRSFVGAATRAVGGNTGLLDLRHLPGVAAIMTAGLACASSSTWHNLKVLVADPTVRSGYDDSPLSLLEATDPWKPFGQGDWISNTLARATVSGKTFAEALEDMTQRRQGKLYTPGAEWLHAVLRPLFMDQWPDQEAYDTEFDRAEVMLGVLGVDAATLHGDKRFGRSHWYGRSTWRASHNRGNAAAELASDFERQGRLWGPLQGSLFGADEQRAATAVNAYLTQFNEIASGRS